MTLRDFEKLNHSDRYDVNMDYAEFVCTHTLLNKRYGLFSLGSFYIEQEWVSGYSNKNLLEIKAFSSDSELLDKYDNLTL
jgi:hypothetical protein